MRITQTQRFSAQSEFEACEAENSGALPEVGAGPATAASELGRSWKILGQTENSWANSTPKITHTVPQRLLVIRIECVLISVIIDRSG